MLKQKYFLADIFILSAEKQPIKLSWRKIVCLQSTFYKIRKSLINKGYLKKLEDVPENPESEDYPRDYMLCVSWLGHINYENWLEMAAISEDVPKSMYVYKDKQQYYYCL